MRPWHPSIVPLDCECGCHDLLACVRCWWMVRGGGVLIGRKSMFMVGLWKSEDAMRYRVCMPERSGLAYARFEVYADGLEQAIESAKRCVGGRRCKGMRVYEWINCGWKQVSP